LKSPRAHCFWGFVNLAFSFSLAIEFLQSTASGHTP
jgi:glycopeptide antibiotics resistance protein